ncbi:MAG: DUF1569 domain-containing protein [Planctomycetota bacterium]
MTIEEAKRRTLRLADLESAVEEVERVLASGYERRGNWSLGQICRHLRLTQDASIDGYPRWMSLFAPVRPLFRVLLLPRLLDGNSMAGLPTVSIYVPSEDSEDAIEVDEYKRSVKRFWEHKGTFHPHPGFGIRERDSLDRFHAAHAAHHLGFLKPSRDD